VLIPGAFGSGANSTASQKIVAIASFLFCDKSSKVTRDDIVLAKSSLREQKPQYNFFVSSGRLSRSPEFAKTGCLSTAVSKEVVCLIVHRLNVDTVVGYDSMSWPSKQQKAENSNTQLSRKTTRGEKSR